MIWGSFSLILKPPKGSLLGLERGSLSWVWIGRVSFVEKLNFQAVIKSAASAASPKAKIQESRGASERRLGCVGLRRESVRFPDIQKLETLNSLIFDLIWVMWD